MSYTPFLQEIKQQKSADRIRAEQSYKNAIETIHSGRRLQLIESRGMLGLWEDSACEYRTRVVMPLSARWRASAQPAGHPGAIRAALTLAALLALIWGALNG